MAKICSFVIVVLVVICSLKLTLALPTPDEERYIDKEYNREFINLLNAIQYAPHQYANLCKFPYYYANALSAPMPKRNSELINSLLSLPKNMNEAGK